MFFLICSLLFIAHREENLLPDYTIGTLQLIINNSSEKHTLLASMCANVSSIQHKYLLRIRLIRAQDRKLTFCAVPQNLLQLPCPIMDKIRMDIN